MVADADVEWTRDLGDGRLLVMERDVAGRRATLAGFRGAGPTQEDALDDLLSRMRAHIDASAELSRSLAPDGELDEKLQQIRRLVDQNLACPHCLAGEPSVWDDVLFHYAHPAGDKLKYCHSPWRERCRRCSAGIGACACGTKDAVR